MSTKVICASPVPDYHKLLQEPISVPSMQHTGISMDGSPHEESVLFYGDGRKSKNFRKDIQNALQDVSLECEIPSLLDGLQPADRFAAVLNDSKKKRVKNNKTNLTPLSSPKTSQARRDIELKTQHLLAQLHEDQQKIQLLQLS